MTDTTMTDAVHDLVRWSGAAIAEHLGVVERTVERIKGELGLESWSLSEIEHERKAA